jgi:hypothetical protein
MTEFKFVTTLPEGTERTESRPFSDRASAISYGQRLLVRGGVVNVGQSDRDKVEWLGSWARSDDRPEWEPAQ